MNLFNYDASRPLDIIFLGRIALDFNPAYSDAVKEEFKPLKDVHYFEMFIGGSPANIAVGITHHGLKAGFFAKISDDQFGDYALDYFNRLGIDTSHITRCTNGEKLGLTFTEMLSPSKSDILMYRNDAADLSLNVDDIDADYIGKAKAIFRYSIGVEPVQGGCSQGCSSRKETWNQGDLRYRLSSIQLGKRRCNLNLLFCHC